MFKITREWIHQNSSHSCGNGFMKNQIAVLGIAWPPKNGWLTALVGQEITQEQKDAFESFARTSKKESNK